MRFEPLSLRPKLAMRLILNMYLLLTVPSNFDNLKSRSGLRARPKAIHTHVVRFGSYDRPYTTPLAALKQPELLPYSDLVRGGAWGCWADPDAY